MLRVEESDGNEPGVCLMHNYHRLSMLSHNQGNDVGLNKLMFMMVIFLHI